MIPDASHKNVHKILSEERKEKLRDIAAILKISGGSVYTILHERSFMFCSKQMSRLLTYDNNVLMAQSAVWRRLSEIMRYAIMDETWVH